jgi:hypothetical protein
MLRVCPKFCSRPKFFLFYYTSNIPRYPYSSLRRGVKKNDLLKNNGVSFSYAISG